MGIHTQTMRLQEKSRTELEAFQAECQQAYKQFQAENLKLDMSRGKPAPAQLELSMDMMDCLKKGDYRAENGLDCRNYGVLDGLPETKAFFAPMLGVKPEEIIVYGNSSLNIMYWVMSVAMTNGVLGGTPWGKLDHVKFLCPVPGYDRHFAVTQFFGMELINVPMNEDGPNMDIVEKLVAEDDSIKGIWCVPKYSNPQGISYSDETVRRFARLKPAAPDFRIYWDNAYTIHHLYDHDQDHLIEILAECKRAGNPDMVYKFASTSKVSFPGSGIAAIAASLNNLEDIKRQMKIQTIGHDKVNQLRHVRFFGDIHGMVEHMRKHADIMRPKFEAVISILERELGGLGIGAWTNPKGGYFISFDSLDGCAKAIVARCKKAGLVMTGAGATYPYGKDPHDSNIRIAPSYPPLSDLVLAMELFALCVKIVSIDKLLTEMNSQQQGN